MNMKLNKKYLYKKMKIIPRIKARLIINSFEQFKKEINEVGKYRHKFTVFKVKLDFENKPQITKSSTLVKTKLKDILKEGIKKVKDVEVQKLLEEVLDEK